MSPGDLLLTGAPTSSAGRTYLVGCLTKGCMWKQLRGNVTRHCPRNHPAQQMKVRLACSSCQWSGWYMYVRECPSGHRDVTILEYGPSRT